ncbi:response regulator [Polaribacter vadi]|uniref:response regulator n=1 Tax=Polaribacter TaxID=52959 RepID=UPI001C08DE0F|nr:MULTISPECIES: response regulator [Polaribacter]MBU3011525.1 response regulator [Polaribacter vadi]MDO6741337.1 response regulator [Polaribacter sp. 1_MG-2023]
MKSKLKNLLIVEDNTLIGKNIVNATKEIVGIENLHLIDNLKEAISLITTINFKLIILDLSLPDGNGVELLKLLKEKDAKNKVLVFSTNTHLKRVCLKYGAFAFFDKANDFDKLIETIRAEN